jgi:hypothetical protein
VQLLAGETLDIRVLVDRPIVEIYVQQGRAAFVVSQSAAERLLVRSPQ